MCGCVREGGIRGKEEGGRREEGDLRQASKGKELVKINSIIHDGLFFNIHHTRMIFVDMLMLIPLTG